MGQEFSGGQQQWHRKCESGACVEYAVRGDLIMIRSSANPEAIASFTRAEWRTFLADAKEGLFDQLLTLGPVPILASV